jgi:hypothetical protein
MSGLRPRGGDSKIRESSRRPAASLHLQIGDLHFGPNRRLGVCARRSDRRTMLPADEDIRDKTGKILSVVRTFGAPTGLKTSIPGLCAISLPEIALVIQGTRDAITGKEFQVTGKNAPHIPCFSRAAVFGKNANSCSRHEGYPIAKETIEPQLQGLFARTMARVSTLYQPISPNSELRLAGAHDADLASKSCEIEASDSNHSGWKLESLTANIGLPLYERST